MSDGAALLAAICAHPAEDTPRLVYADWLQENGQDDRAEFVRVQVQIARLEAAEPKDKGLMWLAGFRLGFHKEHAALNAFLEEDRPCPCVLCLKKRERELWSAAPLVPGREGCVGLLDGKGAGPPSRFEHVVRLYPRRGFFAEARCTAADWLRHGDAIRRGHPVERVTLTTALVLSTAEGHNSPRAPLGLYTIRVSASARGLVPPGDPIPDGYFLSSPATDVLVADALAGLVPGKDFERAVFDRLWPGVEVEQPPAISGPMAGGGAWAVPAPV